MRSSTRFFLAFAAVTLFGLSAGADVAPPGLDDMDCPRGTIATLPEVDPDARDPRGRPLQAWPYCAPSACESDSDCADGRTCSEEVIGFCVEERDVSGQTVRVPRDRGCEPDGSCLNQNSTCEQSRRCVADAAVDPDDGVDEANEAIDEAREAIEEASEEAAEAVEEAEEERADAQDASGCGCRAAPRPGTPGWLLLLAPLALLARRR